MGCASSSSASAGSAVAEQRGAVGSDGKADITSAVPIMPPEGGRTNALTADGVAEQRGVVGSNGKADITSAVPLMPPDDGRTDAWTADGVAEQRVAVGSDDKADITLPVPIMPPEGGRTDALTADGVCLQFCVPMDYPSGTLVKARYTPMPTPKAAPTAESQACSTPSPQPVQIVETVEAKIVHALDRGLPILPQQLPKWDGSWNWIRHENDEISRLTRCDAAELLMETFKKGGFSLKQGTASGKTVMYTSLSNMMEGTQILSCSQMLPKLGKDPEMKMKLEYGQRITPMEKAAALVLEGFRPACVNAASAYHRGGGFTSGGRHALEEAFCNQTTLYASLEKAQQLWDIGETCGMYKSDPGLARKFHQHIPTDGCIVSPMVEIFRGSSDQGYFVYDKTVTVAAVVSVAMYNKNPRMKDSPLDAPKDHHEYEEGLRKKLTAMVHGAALSQADAIIIPDIGCGVFHNDPKIVGRICGEVLATYSSYFKRAIFIGAKNFYAAASEALKNASTSILSLPDGTKSGFVAPIGAQAHLSVGNCVQCGKAIEKADFHELALLVDTSKKSHNMQFLHSCCQVPAQKAFPKHRVMPLPDVTKNAQSFLQALDLNGNGFVEKQEVRCLCALLWDGDVAKDPVAFDKKFEACWMRWDINKSGNMDITEIAGALGNLHRAQSLPGQMRDDKANTLLTSRPCHGDTQHKKRWGVQLVSERAHDEL